MSSLISNISEPRGVSQDTTTMTVRSKERVIMGIGLMALGVVGVILGIKYRGDLNWGAGVVIGGSAASFLGGACLTVFSNTTKTKTHTVDVPAEDSVEGGDASAPEMDIIEAENPGDLDYPAAALGWGPHPMMAAEPVDAPPQPIKTVVEDRKPLREQEVVHAAVRVWGPFLLNFKLMRNVTKSDIDADLEDRIAAFRAINIDENWIQAQLKNMPPEEVTG